MDLVLLTTTLIEMLCQDKESLSVKEYETTEENLTHIEVLVSKEEMGRVIGKNGKNIHSVRTLVQAASSLNGGNKVMIDVDSY